MQTSDNTPSFPPPGWVTKAEAARMLGVSLETLGNAIWVRRLSGWRFVGTPGGGKCKIYPVAVVRGIAQERAAAVAAAEAKVRAAQEAKAAPPFVVPDGFVDREGACRILRITPRALTHWVTDGKVTFGVRIPSRVGGRCTVYPVEKLQQLREEMLGRDTLFKGGAGTFEVPAGWARRFEACQMFGVDKPAWQAWAEGGHLPTGERFEGGPMVYRVEDLKRMLERIGVLAPPYPDPDGSGAVRVPLCGGSVRGAGGRVAVVDAQTMPLLDAAVLSWESVYGGHSNFVGLCCPEKPTGVALRRVIMGVADDDTLQVGHVNGDPLDCRRANLIVRTIQQRSRSARKMKGIKGQPCSSRFKGVCFEKQTGKWRAKIVVDGRTLPVGRFRDELAAAQAYDEAARELFGEHAWLNFPDGVDAWLGHAA